jgi:hypothetical protein
MSTTTQQPKALNLINVSIDWHEGKQGKGQCFNGNYTNWGDLQCAFFKIWQINEKNQNGGYTKVKLTFQFEGEPHTNTVRGDVTDKINNGDFNPSQQQIFNYVAEMICEPHEFFNL